MRGGRTTISRLRKVCHTTRRRLRGVRIMRLPVTSRSITKIGVSSASQQRWCGSWRRARRSGTSCVASRHLTSNGRRSARTKSCQAGRSLGGERQVHGITIITINVWRATWCAWRAGGASVLGLLSFVNSAGATQLLCSWCGQGGCHLTRRVFGGSIETCTSAQLRSRSAFLSRTSIFHAKGRAQSWPTAGWLGYIENKR